jgi:Methyltransferase FkbM domain
MNKNNTSMSPDIFDAFAIPEVNLEKGFIYDSLGTRTRVTFRGGNPDGGGIRKPAQRESWEWIPLLWAVATAKGRGRAVELGAGWAPWITRFYAAARLKGIDDVKLFGVEGDPIHFEYMKAHFADNGIADADAHLVHGLAAKSSGVALFPLTNTPEKSWGLRKVGREGTDREAVLQAVGAKPIDGKPGVYSLAKSPHEYAVQQTISLPDLIGNTEVIDFIHSDIQGSEAEIVASAIDLLDARCRCIAIGTHSHEIEQELRDIFTGHGWDGHHDSVMHRTEEGRLVDGHQVWTNPRFG